MAFMLLCILWAADAKAEARSVRLRESDQGLYGAWLRVGGNANTLGLFARKNGISLEELVRLPNGVVLRYRSEWLRKGFRPSRKDIRYAEAIFHVDEAPVEKLSIVPQSRAVQDQASKTEEALRGQLLSAENKLREAKRVLSNRISALSEERDRARAEAKDNRWSFREVATGFLVGMVFSACISLLLYVSRTRSDPHQDTWETTSDKGTKITYRLASITMPVAGGDGKPRLACPFCPEKNLTVRNALSPTGHPRRCPGVLAKEHAETSHLAGEEADEDVIGATRT